jgi:Ca2+-binding RTX toxin-like protein
MSRSRSVTTLATLATAGVLGLGSLAAPASAADLVHRGETRTPASCRGVAATDIVDPDEDFVGTDAAEVIVVLGSLATVDAAGGNDTICVYGNHANRHESSTIDAGPGNDVVLGISGALVVYGEAGDDVILGNGTEMSIWGGDGKDNINVAGATSSLIDAGDWNDRVTGSPGPDVIVGGQGDDGLYGWDGADGIDGGDGNDLIVGGFGWDDLIGGAGVGTDHCHDYDSPVDGADIGDCVAHLTPAAADDIVFG